MATSGAAEAAAENDEDPKTKLWRLVRLITDDDDGRLDIFDEAAMALKELKNLTVGRPAVPQHFLSPLSSKLMNDPVIVSSGQTFERPYIQEWLLCEVRTCPVTDQVLSYPLLTPNIVIRTLISEWCIENGIPFPEPVSRGGVVVPRKDVKEVYDVVHKVSSSTSISEQKEAVKELRLLTERNRFSLGIIGEDPDTIPRLLSVLCLPGLNDDPEFQEDAVTAILNISKHDVNTKIVKDDPLVLPFLVEILKNGTMETRNNINAASALVLLSALDALSRLSLFLSVRSKIVELGAFKLLVELLKQDDETTKTLAGEAIYNVCATPDNRARALKEGVVGVALKAIMDESLVDKSLAILSLFSRYKEAMEEVRSSGAVPYLLRILRYSTLGGVKEHTITVLYYACPKREEEKWMEMREEENSHATFTRLKSDRNWTVRVIADRLLRSWNIYPTEGGVE